MAPFKTLINYTGYPLEVVMLVRKADHPSETASIVQVHLPPGPDYEDMRPVERSVQTVTYGNAIDVHLNGLELSIESQDRGQIKRRVVATRDSELDSVLNLFDTLEFRFDGWNILFTSSNARDARQTWRFSPVPEPRSSPTS